MNTRGLETLAYLEHLDLSDNLIELCVAMTEASAMSARACALNERRARSWCKLAAPTRFDHSR